IDLPIHLSYTFISLLDSYNSLCLDRHPTHRSLHSFPTRRSSDLPGADIAAAYLTLRNVSSTPVTVTAVASPVAGHAMIHETSVRSEEHTSELQSLRHLVCRLLLDKKN